MEKKETIDRIKNLLSTYGCFGIGELEGYEESNPCIASIGSVVALAEYFTEDYVEINIYQTSSFSSDAIESYEEQYENLSEEILGDIVLLCEAWEAECIKTEKRIKD